MYLVVPGGTVHMFLCELKLAQCFILFDYFNPFQIRFHETNRSGALAFISSSPFITDVCFDLCLIHSNKTQGELQEGGYRDSSSGGNWS